MADAALAGTVAPGFEPVREAFAAGFAERGEVGAALAVIVDERLVVDLVGGSASDDRPAPWQPTTIANAYSVVKPMTAACALLLVERGSIDLDDPVARSWPEFAAAGKEGITVRQLLAHQAGLTLFEKPLALETLLDWDAMVWVLAASAPEWPPGTAHGEHVVTYGHLVGELVRRVDGRSLGTFFREELAGPWALDYHVGLGPAEQLRAAQLRAAPGFSAPLGRPPEIVEPDIVNGAAWRAAEIPAVNGHGTAVAVARFYAGLAAGGELDGVRLLSPGLVAEATARPQLVAHDRVLDQTTAWGLGPQVDEYGFGLGGLGGSGGWWGAPGYALGYVTRLLSSHERVEAVDDAVRDVLAGR
jgi:CubicO group peptidase (beta-lactamase class C family)